MNIFLDGIIFGRQKWGGVSKVWEEYISRFPMIGIRPKLLIPLHYDNDSLEHIRKNCGTEIDIITDYFYWPKRIFDRPNFREHFINLYTNKCNGIFQSTYYSYTSCKNMVNVITVYDMIAEIFNNDNRSKWSELTIERKKAAILKADRIITISESTKRDLLKIYPMISSEKVSVIYLGFAHPENNKAISFDDITNKFAIKVKPFSYFLYVGKRNGYKNFKLLVNFLSNNSKFRDLQIICVGGEENFEVLESLRSKGLNNSFVFLSKVTDQELSVLYKNAVSLIYPSKYEGFGLPLLEAMANRCPVICSNTSSLPEVGGEAVIYFDPDSLESFEEALNFVSTANRDRITTLGYKQIEKFSWDSSFENLVGLYQKLI